MMNQFFGNKAIVRNMSRVEAAPIYSAEAEMALSVCIVRMFVCFPCPAAAP